VYKLGDSWLSERAKQFKTTKYVTSQSQSDKIANKVLSDFID